MIKGLAPPIRLAAMGVLSDRRYRFVIAFWLIIMVYDAATRVANPYLAQPVSGVEQSSLVVEPQARLTADLYATLTARLKRELKVPSETGSDEVEPLADMVPDESYILRSSNYSYRLLGLFKRGDRFAVLERTSVVAQQSNLIDVRVGDELDDYLLTSISKRAIEARNSAGEVIALRLFEASRVDEN